MNAFLRLARSVEDKTAIGENRNRLRIEFVGGVDFAQGFGKAPQAHKNRGVPVMRGDGVGVERERAMEFPFGGGHIPVAPEIDEGERAVRGGQ